MRLIDGHFSRMTIGVSGAEDGLEQIISQVEKLVDVLRCTDHTFDKAVTKEMGLIKVAISARERADFSSLDNVRRTWRVRPVPPSAGACSGAFSPLSVTRCAERASELRPTASPMNRR